MTDDEITLRLLETMASGDYFSLHDSAIPGRFGDVGDEHRVRQIAWDLIREGMYGAAQYDTDSQHLIPLADALDGDVSAEIPVWVEKLMHDGGMRVSRLYPKGHEMLDDLRRKLRGSNP